MGTETSLTSPHSLCRSRGWALSRSSSLDPPALSFLFTRKSPESCLSRQVPRRPETPPSQQKATVRGPGCCSRRFPAVYATHSPPAPPRLGGLCQARLRWPYAGVALSGSLHPSRGHFQSSLVGPRTRSRDFPLEGLRPRRQARSDDAGRHRVLASLLSARAAQRLRPHSSLRVPSEPLSCFPPSTEPTTAAALPPLDGAGS